MGKTGGGPSKLDLLLRTQESQEEDEQREQQALDTVNISVDDILEELATGRPSEPSKQPIVEKLPIRRPSEPKQEPKPQPKSESKESSSLFPASTALAKIAQLGNAINPVRGLSAVIANSNFFIRGKSTELGIFQKPMVDNSTGSLDKLLHDKTSTDSGTASTSSRVNDAKASHTAIGGTEHNGTDYGEDVITRSTTPPQVTGSSTASSAQGLGEQVPDLLELMDTPMEVANGEIQKKVEGTSGECCLPQSSPTFHPLARSEISDQESPEQTYDADTQKDSIQQLNDGNGFEPSIGGLDAATSPLDQISSASNILRNSESFDALSSSDTHEPSDDDAGGHSQRSKNTSPLASISPDLSSKASDSPTHVTEEAADVIVDGIYEIPETLILHAAEIPPTCSADESSSGETVTASDELHGGTDIPKSPKRDAVTDSDCLHTVHTSHVVDSPGTASTAAVVSEFVNGKEEGETVLTSKDLSAVNSISVQENEEVRPTSETPRGFQDQGDQSTDSPCLSPEFIASALTDMSSTADSTPAAIMEYPISAEHSPQFKVAQSSISESPVSDVLEPAQHMAEVVSQFQNSSPVSPILSEEVQTPSKTPELFSQCGDGNVGSPSLLNEQVVFELPNSTKELNQSTLEQTLLDPDQVSQPTSDAISESAGSDEFIFDQQIEEAILKPRSSSPLLSGSPTYIEEPRESSKTPDACLVNTVGCDGSSPSLLSGVFKLPGANSSEKPDIGMLDETPEKFNDVSGTRNNAGTVSALFGTDAEQAELLEETAFARPIVENSSISSPKPIEQLHSIAETLNDEESPNEHIGKPSLKQIVGLEETSTPAMVLNDIQGSSVEGSSTAEFQIYVTVDQRQEQAAANAVMSTDGDNSVPNTSGKPSEKKYERENQITPETDRNNFAKPCLQQVKALERTQTPSMTLNDIQGLSAKSSGTERFQIDVTADRKEEQTSANAVMSTDGDNSVPDTPGKPAEKKYKREKQISPKTARNNIVGPSLRGSTPDHLESNSTSFAEQDERLEGAQTAAMTLTDIQEASKEDSGTANLRINVTDDQGEEQAAANAAMPTDIDKSAPNISGKPVKRKYERKKQIHPEADRNNSAKSCLQQDKKQDFQDFVVAQTPNQSAVIPTNGDNSVSNITGKPVKRKYERKKQITPKTARNDSAEPSLQQLEGPEVTQTAVMTLNNLRGSSEEGSGTSLFQKDAVAKTPNQTAVNASIPTDGDDSVINTSGKPVKRKYERKKQITLEADRNNSAKPSHQQTEGIKEAQASAAALNDAQESSSDSSSVQFSKKKSTIARRQYQTAINVTIPTDGNNSAPCISEKPAKRKYERRKEFSSGATAARAAEGRGQRKRNLDTLATAVIQDGTVSERGRHKKVTSSEQHDDGSTSSSNRAAVHQTRSMQNNAAASASDSASRKSSRKRVTESRSPIMAADNNSKRLRQKKVNNLEQQPGCSTSASAALQRGSSTLSDIMVDFSDSEGTSTSRRQLGRSRPRNRSTNNDQKVLMAAIEESDDDEAPQQKRRNIRAPIGESEKRGLRSQADTKELEVDLSTDLNKLTAEEAQIRILTQYTGELELAEQMLQKSQFPLSSLDEKWCKKQVEETKALLDMWTQQCENARQYRRNKKIKLPQNQAAMYPMFGVYDNSRYSLTDGFSLLATLYHVNEDVVKANYRRYKNPF